MDKGNQESGSAEQKRQADENRQRRSGDRQGYDKKLNGPNRPST